MKRIATTIGIMILTMALWGGLLMLAALQGWGESSLTQSSDPADFSKAAIAKINETDPGNAMYALIVAGEIDAQYHTSKGDPVDANTLFQMASVSKWVTSIGIMKLVASGKIDLDTPVNSYLTRWQVPQSDFDTQNITVRRLLSHTAGLTDGLGYAGFASAAEVQTLEASLRQPNDAWSPFGGAAIMGAAADGTWRYSGGGYTLLQLLIEEVTGRAFNDFMVQDVLRPLGMRRSTFVVDRESTENLADFYDTDGTIAPHYYYTALAAASLYATTNDLIEFARFHCEGQNSSSFLSRQILRSARQPHGHTWGMDVWGLGPALYLETAAGDYVVGHDGGNRPAINTTVRIDPKSCDGIVVLASGTSGLASTLGNHWLRWRYGEVGPLSTLGQVNRQIPLIGIGWLVILVVGLVVAWRRAKRT